MTTDILGPARHFIGTRYVESAKADILALTGLALAVGPNDFTTRDVRTDRVMIRVDDEGNITDLVIS